MRNEVAAIKKQLAALDAEEEEQRNKLNNQLLGLPNLLASQVPHGTDKLENLEIKQWGEPRKFDFNIRDHVEIGEGLGLDMRLAAKLSGARFALGIGQIARLERALFQFMLDLHRREHGYTEVSSPLMVLPEILEGTGQLPKFAEDLFEVSSGHYLIPTAEVPLTNLVRDQILDEERELKSPMRFTAHTACFRAEAGAAGKDTKGLIRLHQFEKVELVSLCRPEDSEQEHLHMRGAAQKVLELLELPYRVVELCSGDIGFAAARTFDLEVWLPSQNCYREISSVSNCWDFQARRMKARCRKSGDKETRFIHTLNGSGVSGRALVALLENHQEKDGSVRLPKAICPYMDNLEQLEPETLLA